MKRACRVFAVAVAAGVSLSAADHKVVDGKDGKTPKIEDRNASVAKKVDPKGGIKTNVKVNKAFTAAAKGGSVEKKPVTPPKSKDGAPPAAPPPGPKPKPPK